MLAVAYLHVNRPIGTVFAEMLEDDGKLLYVAEAVGKVKATP
jgi:hypothetical protein